MAEFFRSSPKSVADIAALLSLDLGAGADRTRVMTGVAALDRAGPDDVTFLENTLYKDALLKTRAGVALVAAPFASYVPAATIALIVPHPHAAFAMVATALFPQRRNPV